jgi:predicted dehydrogenase
LEVTQVDWASGYPLNAQINGGTWNGQVVPFEETHTIARPLTDQPYIQGEHLKIDEPHVYADIMDLADAILGKRAPRATGEQARHVVEIVEKARYAQETGQTQTLVTQF